MRHQEMCSVDPKLWATILTPNVRNKTPETALHVLSTNATRRRRDTGAARGPRTVSETPFSRDASADFYPRHQDCCGQPGAVLLVSITPQMICCPTRRSKSVRSGKTLSHEMSRYSQPWTRGDSVSPASFQSKSILSSSQHQPEQGYKSRSCRGAGRRYWRQGPIPPGSSIVLLRVAIFASDLGLDPGIVPCPEGPSETSDCFWGDPWLSICPCPILYFGRHAGSNCNR